MRNNRRSLKKTIFDCSVEVDNILEILHDAIDVFIDESDSDEESSESENEESYEKEFDEEIEEDFTDLKEKILFSEYKIEMLKDEPGNEDLKSIIEKDIQKIKENVENLKRKLYSYHDTR
ncbi:unnamed protein product [Rotaria magnacalcarata]|uniref:Uncharacterized protein n=1 Tax=Rotaria magnacalcarata TaxID=392030 RepID=A0A816Z7J1_9BILA|nr:unnamed protein product [Rotaria magnacalcarata]CAF2188389.1 unnamed protein product [Rotaria magnacalcarata]CAF4374912.1 unnamed protein product [Rotaria magnacalcarata]CAF4522976.1 unnamed protein product [Rotaria magnacalcarata]